MLWNFAVEEHHHSKQTSPEERPHRGPVKPYFAAFHPNIFGADVVRRINDRRFA